MKHRPLYTHDEMFRLACSREHLAGVGATHALEQLLTSHYGKKHCIVTSNATTSILAVGIASGLRGKEVITNPMIWGGSLGALSLLDNTFSISGIEPDSLNLDWRSLRSARSKSTAAVLANDQFGTAHSQIDIRRECDHLGLLYISDSSCSLGAYDHISERPAGSLADIVITSFVSGKGVVAGEGGAILCDETALYERLLAICVHPDRQRKELGWNNPFAPLNARMNPFSAQLLVATWNTQMAQLRHRQNAMFTLLKDVSENVEAAPFFEPRSSTYFDPLLRMRNNSLTGSEQRHLSFIHEMEQAPLHGLRFRIDPRIEEGLEIVRRSPYVALSDIMTQPWPRS